MVDTGIFATTAEVQRKVGANANTTANAEAYINDFMTQVESFINCYTRKNYSDAFAGLDVDVKGILKECASCLAAMAVINYDMAAIGITEAIARLNYLRDRAYACLNELKDQDVEAFIAGA